MLEINGKDLFKGLRVCKPDTPLGDTQTVLKKREKLGVLIEKSTFLRKNSLHSQPLGWSGTVVFQMSGSWVMDVRLSGHVDVLS